MKRIEPGCLAMVVNVPEHAGLTVEVLRRVSLGDRFSAGGKPLQAGCCGWGVAVANTTIAGCFREKNLMRIDGYEDPDARDTIAIDQLKGLRGISKDWGRDNWEDFK